MTDDMYYRGYVDGVCYNAEEDHTEKFNYVESLSEADRARYYEGFYDGSVARIEVQEEVSN